MTRTTFERELQGVKDEVLLMASMVEDAVLKSAEALRDNNLMRSQLVLENDSFINRKRYEIELVVLTLMATQQPAARDLRILTASLDICTELERIGDYAKGIANINLRSQGLSLPKMLKDIFSMAEKAVDLLHRAMTAFSEDDHQTARDLILEDDVIDKCYTELYTHAVNNVLNDPRNMERSNYLIAVAHNLERLGDRATNICERVIYIASGEIPASALTTGRLQLPPDKNW